jgi:hypothetical protein
MKIFMMLSFRWTHYWLETSSHSDMESQVLHPPSSSWTFCALAPYWLFSLIMTPRMGMWMMVAMTERLVAVSTA